MTKIVESEYELKVATFYLDRAEDIKAFEKLANNPCCTIRKKETEKRRETFKEYDDGKLVGSTSTEHIIWIVEYELEKVK